MSKDSAESDLDSSSSASSTCSSGSFSSSESDFTSSTCSSSDDDEDEGENSDEKQTSEHQEDERSSLSNSGWLNARITPGEGKRGAGPQFSPRVARVQLKLTEGKVERSISMRAHVLDEIVTTEKEYADSLGILVRHYLAPLQRELKEKGASKATLSEKDVELLFSNVPELLDLSYELLNRLELRKRSQSKLPGSKPAQYVVGDVFAEMADGFRCYTTYCCNHPAAVETFKRLMTGDKAKSDFVQWEARISALEETRNVPLDGYLIKPVQRIMKYPLLLRELLKYTEEDCEEYPQLLQSLDKINQVLDYVNNRKRMYESEMKMREISTSVIGWHGFELVKPSRQFEHEVSYVGEKPACVPGKIFLFSDICVVTKSGARRISLKAGSDKDVQRLKLRIPVDRLTVVDVHGGDDFGVDILDRDDPEGSRLTCSLPDGAQKSRLMKCLKRIKQDYYLAHANELAAEAEARRYIAEFKFVMPDAKELRRREEEAKANKSSAGLSRATSLSSLFGSSSKKSAFSRTKSTELLSGKQRIIDSDLKASTKKRSPRADTSTSATRRHGRRHRRREEDGPGSTSSHDGVRRQKHHRRHRQRHRSNPAEDADQKCEDEGSEQKPGGATSESAAASSELKRGDALKSGSRRNRHHRRSRMGGEREHRRHRHRHTPVLKADPTTNPDHDSDAAEPPPRPNSTVAIPTDERPEEKELATAKSTKLGKHKDFN